MIGLAIKSHFSGQIKRLSVSINFAIELWITYLNWMYTRVNVLYYIMTNYKY